MDCRLQITRRIWYIRSFAHSRIVSVRSLQHYDNVSANPSPTFARWCQHG